MNINIFEKQFNETILKRGYDYYINGHVEDLIQIDDTNWKAEVYGTQMYVVDVRLNTDGDIIHTDCGCPYEDDCKHIAATLYAIQDPEHISTALPSSNPNSNPTIKEYLQSQTKEQLIALITKVGQNHPAFIKELEMLLTTPNYSLQSAEELILHHINEVQDSRSGFIPWNETSKALKGINAVQDQIEEYIGNSEYLTAIQLSLLCFQHAFDAMQDSDDSSGYFGNSLNESIVFIEHAIWEGVDLWSKDQYETVYELVLKLALTNELDGWSDWRISLLHSCIPLCQDDTIEERYIALLTSLKKTENSWSSEYFNKELNELQYQLIVSKYSKKEVETFLEENINDAKMRERVIISATERGDYSKVLQLSIDGQAHDQDSPGIVTDWKRYAFSAHKELGNKNEMRELAIELLMNGRDDEFYSELKMLYSAEEWLSTREKILDDLKEKNSGLYGTLIVVEQQTERILDYCKESPTRIESYYSYLTAHYYEEVCALFIDTISVSAARASDRKRYQDVCRSISKMKKAGYELEAKQLIGQLIQKYPKRRAFMDELGKLE